MDTITIEKVEPAGPEYLVGDTIKVKVKVAPRRSGTPAPGNVSHPAMDEQSFTVRDKIWLEVALARPGAGPLVLQCGAALTVVPRATALTVHALPKIGVASVVQDGAPPSLAPPSYGLGRATVNLAVTGTLVADRVTVKISHPGIDGVVKRTLAAGQTAVEVTFSKTTEHTAPLTLQVEGGGLLDPAASSRPVKVQGPRVSFAAGAALRWFDTGPAKLKVVLDQDAPSGARARIVSTALAKPVDVAFERGAREVEATVPLAAAFEQPQDLRLEAVKALALGEGASTVARVQVRPTLSFLEQWVTPVKSAYQVGEQVELHVFLSGPAHYGGSASATIKSDAFDDATVTYGAGEGGAKAVRVTLKAAENKSVALASPVGCGMKATPHTLLVRASSVLEFAPEWIRPAAGPYYVGDRATLVVAANARPGARMEHAKVEAPVLATASVRVAAGASDPLTVEVPVTFTRAGANVEVSLTHLAADCSAGPGAKKRLTVLEARKLNFDSRFAAMCMEPSGPYTTGDKATIALALSAPAARPHGDTGTGPIRMGTVSCAAFPAPVPVLFDEDATTARVEVSFENYPFGEEPKGKAKITLSLHTGAAGVLGSLVTLEPELRRVPKVTFGDEPFADKIKPTGGIFRMSANQDARLSLTLSSPAAATGASVTLHCTGGRPDVTVTWAPGATLSNPVDFVAPPVPDMYVLTLTVVAGCREKVVQRLSLRVGDDRQVQFADGDDWITPAGPYRVNGKATVTLAVVGADHSADAKLRLTCYAFENGFIEHTLAATDWSKRTLTLDVTFKNKSVASRDLVLELPPGAASPYTLGPRAKKSLKVDDKCTVYFVTETSARGAERRLSKVVVTPRAHLLEGDEVTVTVELSDPARRALGQTGDGPFPVANLAGESLAAPVPVLMAEGETRATVKLTLVKSLAKKKGRFHLEELSIDPKPAALGTHVTAEVRLSPKRPVRFAKVAFAKSDRVKPPKAGKPWSFRVGATATLRLKLGDDKAKRGGQRGARVYVESPAFGPVDPAGVTEVADAGAKGPGHGVGAPQWGQRYRLTTGAQAPARHASWGAIDGAADGCVVRWSGERWELVTHAGYLVTFEPKATTASVEVELKVLGAATLTLHAPLDCVFGTKHQTVSVEVRDDAVRFPADDAWIEPEGPWAVGEEVTLRVLRASQGKLAGRVAKLTSAAFGREPSSRLPGRLKPSRAVEVEWAADELLSKPVKVTLAAAGEHEVALEGTHDYEAVGPLKRALPVRSGRRLHFVPRHFEEDVTATLLGEVALTVTLDAPAREAIVATLLSPMFRDTRYPVTFARGDISQTVRVRIEAAPAPDDAVVSIEGDAQYMLYVTPLPAAPPAPPPPPLAVGDALVGTVSGATAKVVRLGEGGRVAVSGYESQGAEFEVGEHLTVGGAERAIYQSSMMLYELAESRVRLPIKIARPKIRFAAEPIRGGYVKRKKLPVLARGDEVEVAVELDRPAPVDLHAIITSSVTDPRDGPVTIPQGATSATRRITIRRAAHPQHPAWLRVYPFGVAQHAFDPDESMDLLSSVPHCQTRIWVDPFPSVEFPPTDTPEDAVDPPPWVDVEEIAVGDRIKVTVALSEPVGADAPPAKFFVSSDVFRARTAVEFAPGDAATHKTLELTVERTAPRSVVAVDIDVVSGCVRGADWRRALRVHPERAVYLPEGAVALRGRVAAGWTATWADEKLTLTSGTETHAFDAMPLEARSEAGALIFQTLRPKEGFVPGDKVCVAVRLAVPAAAAGAKVQLTGGPLAAPVEVAFKIAEVEATALVELAVESDPGTITLSSPQRAVLGERKDVAVRTYAPKIGFARLPVIWAKGVAKRLHPGVAAYAHLTLDKPAPFLGAGFVITCTKDDTSAFAPIRGRVEAGQKEIRVPLRVRADLTDFGEYELEVAASPVIVPPGSGWALERLRCRPDAERKRRTVAITDAPKVRFAPTPVAGATHAAEQRAWQSEREYVAGTDELDVKVQASVAPDADLRVQLRSRAFGPRSYVVVLPKNSTAAVTQRVKLLRGVRKVGATPLPFMPVDLVAPDGWLKDADHARLMVRVRYDEPVLVAACPLQAPEAVAERDAVAALDAETAARELSPEECNLHRMFLVEEHGSPERPVESTRGTRGTFEVVHERRHAASGERALVMGDGEPAIEMIAGRHNDPYYEESVLGGQYPVIKRKKAAALAYDRAALAAFKEKWARHHHARLQVQVGEQDYYCDTVFEEHGRSRMHPHLTVVDDSLTEGSVVVDAPYDVRPAIEAEGSDGRTLATLTLWQKHYWWHKAGWSAGPARRTWHRTKYALYMVADLLNKIGRLPIRTVLEAVSLPALDPRVYHVRLAACGTPKVAPPDPAGPVAAVGAAVKVFPSDEFAFNFAFKSPWPDVHRGESGAYYDVRMGQTAYDAKGRLQNDDAFRSGEEVGSTRTREATDGGGRVQMESRGVRIEEVAGDRIAAQAALQRYDRPGAFLMERGENLADPSPPAEIAREDFRVPSKVFHPVAKDQIDAPAWWVQNSVRGRGQLRGEERSRTKHSRDARTQNLIAEGGAEVLEDLETGRAAVEGALQVLPAPIRPKLDAETAVKVVAPRGVGTAMDVVETGQEVQKKTGLGKKIGRAVESSVDAIDDAIGLDLGDVLDEAIEVNETYKDALRSALITDEHIHLSITRNGRVDPLFQDVVGPVGQALAVAKKVRAAASDLTSNFNAALGWGFQFSMRFLDGNLTAYWGFKEHTDTRVFRWYAVAVDLTLLRLNFVLTYGAQATFLLYKFEAVLYVKLVVDSSLKGQFERETPDSVKPSWMDTWIDAKVQVEGGARVVLVSEKHFTLNGAIKSGMKASFRLLDLAENPLGLEYRVYWMGVSFAYTARIKGVCDKTGELALIQGNPPEFPLVQGTVPGSAAEGHGYLRAAIAEAWKNVAMQRGRIVDRIESWQALQLQMVRSATRQTKEVAGDDGATVRVSRHLQTSELPGYKLVKRRSDSDYEEARAMWDRNKPLWDAQWAKCKEAFDWEVSTVRQYLVRSYHVGTRLAALVAEAERREAELVARLGRYDEMIDALTTLSHDVESSRETADAGDRADDRLAARFAAIYDKAYVQWTTGSDLLGHPLTKFDDLLTSLRWWAEKRTAW